MTDRREQVLARLVVIAQGISGVGQVVRNQPDTTGTASSAAVVIFDGDESVDGGGAGRGRPPTATVFVEMVPEVQIRAGRPSATIGTVMNGLRVLLVKAVLGDATLRAILGTNGEVRYGGLNTELARGKTMMAEMGLIFEIRYPLIYSEL